MQGNHFCLARGNHGLTKEQKITLMGSFDGAEIDELIVLYVLDELSMILERKTSLYQENRLGILMDKARKELSTVFKTFGLKITAVANQKIVNFLDITFNLHNNYQPYRKPNDDPLFIHSQSNHPLSITKQLPKTINKCISTLSSDRHSFDATTAPLYEEALRRSNFNVKLKYNPEEPTKQTQEHNLVQPTIQQECPIKYWPQLPTNI